VEGASLKGVERGRDRGRHPLSKANFADNKSRLQTGREDAGSATQEGQRGEFKLYALHSNCQYYTPFLGVTGYAHAAFDSLWLVRLQKKTTK